MNKFFKDTIDFYDISHLKRDEFRYISNMFAYVSANKVLNINERKFLISELIDFCTNCKEYEIESNDVLYTLFQLIKEKQTFNINIKDYNFNYENKNENYKKVLIEKLLDGFKILELP